MIVFRLWSFLFFIRYSCMHRAVHVIPRTHRRSNTSALVWLNKSKIARIFKFATSSSICLYIIKIDSKDWKRAVNTMIMIIISDLCLSPAEMCDVWLLSRCGNFHVKLLSSRYRFISIVVYGRSSHTDLSTAIRIGVSERVRALAKLIHLCISCAPINQSYKCMRMLCHDECRLRKNENHLNY